MDAHPAFRAVDGKDHGEEEKEHGQHPDHDDDSDTDSDGGFYGIECIRGVLVVEPFHRRKGKIVVHVGSSISQGPACLSFILSPYFKFCIKKQHTSKLRNSICNNKK